MIKALNKNITINSQELKTHSKASEKYVDVTFNTKYGIWSGWVPVEYRRTGVSLNTDDEISEYLLETYNIMDSLNPGDWQKSETRFWDEEKKGATVTGGFFDVLAQGGWKCREHELPSNPNFARRIQDLKEMGYTLATDTKKYCSHCKKNTTQLILLPIPIISIAGNGYETWSKSLRERILRVLNNFDVYEGKVGTHLLPDHKFSEIRWDSETKGENPDTMTDEEIRNKFQLMTNQRNQQKREACRICFQTRKRQYPFGIEYFYSGTENWDLNIPEKGQQAESGCIGCGWYDLNKWREEVINKLSE